MIKNKNKYWQAVEKLAFSYFAGGNVKWFSHCRTQSVTQKRKHRIILWSHSRTPRHIPKRNENEHSDACPCIFIAASFTTAKGRTRQMPISRGLGKQAMACTYTDDCSAIKRSEALTHAGQDEPPIVWVHFCLQNRRSHENTQTGGCRVGGAASQGQGFSGGGEPDRGGIAQHC